MRSKWGLVVVFSCSLVAALAWTARSTDPEEDCQHRVAQCAEQENQYWQMTDDCILCLACVMIAPHIFHEVSEDASGVQFKVETGGCVKNLYSCWQARVSNDASCRDRIVAAAAACPTGAIVEGCP